MLKFNRLPKNKKFDYKPRYYNPEAEEKASRKNPKLEKGSFARHRPNILYDDSRKKARLSQNLRIVWIVAFLSLGAFYILELIPAWAAIAGILFLLLAFSANLRKASRR